MDLDGTAMTFLSRLQEAQSHLKEAQNSLDQLHADFESWIQSSHFTPSHTGLSAISIPTHRNIIKKSQSEECPHADCAGTTRTRFKERKNLIRHYTTHIQLSNECCIYCHAVTSDGNKFISHLNNCKAKSASSISDEVARNATRRRRELLREAGNVIDRSLPQVKGRKRKRNQDLNKATFTSQLNGAVVSVPPTQANGPLRNSQTQTQCLQHALSHGSERLDTQPDSFSHPEQTLTPSNLPYTLDSAAEVIRPAFTGYPIDLDEHFESFASILIQDEYQQPGFELQTPIHTETQHFGTLAPPRAAYNGY